MWDNDNAEVIAETQECYGTETVEETLEALPAEAFGLGY